MSEATAFIPPHALNTAVLFLVFNRLDTTKQVFEAIRDAKSPRLYVAADGARANKEGEADKVQVVRDYIMQNIDWECEVKTMFRERNLGCKMAVSGAIDWFFENEEMGIILEDDCLPSQSFFWYCEELLERYKDDMRIFLISGHNKQNSWKEETNDYFFSNLGGIWGWASWRRAWKHYDIEMSDIENFIKNNNFVNIFDKKLGKIRQDTIYKSIIINKMDTWDYQWGYTRHKNNALACVPTKSLVENIGFGQDATHTFGANHDNVKKQEITFPLKENNFLIPDRNYDEKFFQKKNILRKVLETLIRIFKS
jgi:hypothetical protein